MSESLKLRHSLPSNSLLGDAPLALQQDDGVCRPGELPSEDGAVAGKGISSCGGRHAGLASRNCFHPLDGSPRMPDAHQHESAQFFHSFILFGRAGNLI